MSEHPFGIGRPVARKKDFRLLTGTGRFTDVSHVPGELYGVVVRSPMSMLTLAPSKIFCGFGDAGTCVAGDPGCRREFLGKLPDPLDDQGDGPGEQEYLQRGEKPRRGGGSEHPRAIPGGGDDKGGQQQPFHH